MKLTAVFFLFISLCPYDILRSELAGKDNQLQQMALKLEEFKENMLKVTPLPPAR